MTKISFLIQVCILLALIFSGGAVASGDTVIVSSIECACELDSDNFDDSFNARRNPAVELSPYSSRIRCSICASVELNHSYPAVLGHLRAPPRSNFS